MPFQPGNNANPKGRPKGPGTQFADIRAMAREHCPRAIERLRELCEDPSGKVAVAACIAMLNRGWGMPVQPVEDITPPEIKLVVL